MANLVFSQGLQIEFPMKLQPVNVQSEMKRVNKGTHVLNMYKSNHISLGSVK